MLQDLFGRKEISKFSYLTSNESVNISFEIGFHFWDRFFMNEFFLRFAGFFFLWWMQILLQIALADSNSLSIFKRFVSKGTFPWRQFLSSKMFARKNARKEFLVKSFFLVMKTWYEKFHLWLSWNQLFPNLQNRFCEKCKSAKVQK